METKVGLKYDNGKIDYSLLPLEPIEGLGKVLTFGSQKYEANSWQQVKPKSRYYSAMMRHIIAHLKWEEEGNTGLMLDEESGLPHLDHALCNLVFFRELSKKIDDK
jgi:hypothetical protein